MAMLYRFSLYVESMYIINYFVVVPIKLDTTNGIRGTENQRTILILVNIQL